MIEEMMTGRFNEGRKTVGYLDMACQTEAIPTDETQAVVGALISAHHLSPTLSHHPRVMLQSSWYCWWLLQGTW